MSRTVLVVEDTELLRRMYVDRLTQDGFRVLSAADGLEALGVLRSDTPDLILLDLIMPKMSGLEVLELVKRDPRLKDIPVVILSNLGQETDVQRCIGMGAVDYLIKNDSRPADISARITSIFEMTDSQVGPGASYRLTMRDHEADADRFIADAHLVRRMWCPACEVELELELTSQSGKPGWYDAHVICAKCGREY